MNNNKKKFWSAMLEERLNYFYVLPIENVTSKSLAYKKAIKEYVAKKNVRKKVLQWCVRHLVNKNIMLFFLILWCLWFQLF